MLGTSQLGISFSDPFISYRRSSIALLRTAYLCCAFTVLCSALPCLSYLCYAFAILLEAKPFLRCSLLVLCKAILRISRIFPCSAEQRNAVPLHCRQSRASPLPRCSKLCNAFADRQDSLPGLACPCMARHCFSFAIPRLAAASLLYASPRVSFAPPRLSIPLPVDSLR